MAPRTEVFVRLLRNKSIGNFSAYFKKVFKPIFTAPNKRSSWTPPLLILLFVTLFLLGMFLYFNCAPRFNRKYVLDGWNIKKARRDPKIKLIIVKPLD